jgi:ATP-dependent DNA helicase Rep
MHGLNTPQREAVLHTQTPLLVLAGAGSGKTRVITEKIAHLIASGQHEARYIAAITFTNKAAREMRERVAKRVKAERAEGLTVTTFHALGLRFLQIEHARIGLRRGFSVFDSDDQLGVIRDLAPQGAKKDAVEQLRGLLSRAKNEGMSPEQAQAAAGSAREREAAAIYGKYQQRLSAFNAVDFDDLIRLPLQLLEADPDLAAAWRERIRYLLVDECQDTNGAQYRLLRQLAGPRGAITCVGDDDQSIYAWRGAQPENLDLLARDYPDLKVIKLEQNYRCSARILRAANTLIANNPHTHVKQLWSDQGQGQPIRVWQCRDSEHEADRVAAEIAFSKNDQQVPWSDFAILFRGNHQSRPLEKALQMLRIPYHLSGGTAFLDRGEVKDALAWLRLLANPDDDSAFLRAIGSPKREVGSASLAKLAELAHHAGMPMLRAAAQISLLKQLPARAMSGLREFIDIVHRLQGLAETAPASELCRALVTQSGLIAAVQAQTRDPAVFERRRANLEELADWFAGAAAGSARDLAAQLALLSHSDRDEPGNAVRLMSLHGAKGLEFGHVFIVGCEDGNLPHEASMDEGQLNEERRLMYVGITRAKHRLWLSHSSQTRRWGQMLSLQPSRFLSELPAADLQRDGDDPEREAVQRRERGRAHLDAIASLLGD